MDPETGILSPLEMGLCLNSGDAKKLRIRAGGNVFHLEPLPCAYSVIKLALEQEAGPHISFQPYVSHTLDSLYSAAEIEKMFCQKLLFLTLLGFRLYAFTILFF
jgi:hypothetical protein